LKRTAEAARVHNSIIRHLAVKLKEIHSDMPQVQNRSSESGTWEEGCSALEVPAVRQALL